MPEKGVRTPQARVPALRSLAGAEALLAFEQQLQLGVRTFKWGTQRQKWGRGRTQPKAIGREPLGACFEFVPRPRTVQSHLALGNGQRMPWGRTLTDGEGHSRGSTAESTACFDSPEGEGKSWLPADTLVKPV